MRGSGEASGQCRVSWQEQIRSNKSRIWCPGELSHKASTFWDMGRKTPSSHYSELLVAISYKLIALTTPSYLLVEKLSIPPLLLGERL